MPRSEVKASTYEVRWRPAADQGRPTFDRWQSYCITNDVEEAKRKARECYALQWREVQIIVCGWAECNLELTS